MDRTEEEILARACGAFRYEPPPVKCRQYPPLTTVRAAVAGRHLCQRCLPTITSKYSSKISAIAAGFLVLALKKHFDLKASRPLSMNTNQAPLADRRPSRSSILG